MATEVNGYGHQGGFEHQANASTSTAGYGAAPVSTSGQSQADLSKEEVAWYFVESYYTTMSRTPEKLHLFFNKRSQLVSGVEEEKSSVATGQKAIKDRLAALDFEECKVRVTNVDSQASDSNIVIQVIGEMSNKSQPHRKFAQTFVLAAQTNGYFVLNDIFRYLKDEEEDVEGEVPQAESEAATGTLEPAPTAVDTSTTATKEVVQSEEDVAQVDQKLEETKQEEDEVEEETTATVANGTPSVDEADEPASDEPAAEEPEAKVDEVEAEAAKEELEPEKPADPVPTPAAEARQPAATPAAPPKPAVPRSWAQLAAGNRTAAAAAPKPAADAPQPKAAPAPAAAASQQSPAAPSAPAAPAREASPDSNKDGSNGGWHVAGAEHTRKQSRAQNAPAVGQDGRVRAFVKNVTEDVDAEALKAALSKFGELVYFDVARQKKAAFVEYKTVAGFQAAVNANPHRVGSEDIWVEERRVAGGFVPRGGARGGRGGFENRGRGGNFGGRGRGGSGNVTPRGGRGGAQA